MEKHNLDVGKNMFLMLIWYYPHYPYAYILYKKDGKVFKIDFNFKKEKTDDY